MLAAGQRQAAALQPYAGLTAQEATVKGAALAQARTPFPTYGVRRQSEAATALWGGALPPAT